jgi:hypothetical protein
MKKKEEEEEEEEGEEEEGVFNRICVYVYGVRGGGSRVKIIIIYSIKYNNKQLLIKYIYNINTHKRKKEEEAHRFCTKKK